MATVTDRVTAHLRSNWELTNQLNDRYRVSAYNRLFYGHKLVFRRNLNLVLDVVVAFGLPVIGAWGYWAPDGGGWPWGVAVLILCVLAALPSILQLPRSVERYGRLFAQHTDLFYSYKRLVYDAQSLRGFTTEMVSEFAVLQDRFQRLSLDDDPGFSKRLDRKCTEEMNREIPEAKLWWPEVDSLVGEEKPPEPAKPVCEKTVPFERPLKEPGSPPSRPPPQGPPEKKDE